ncbi:MAG: rhodanese-like domain-containing protein, partial [Acidobacteriota bacterium]
MNRDQPSRPANVANIVAINQGKLPLTMDAPRAAPLAVDEVSDLLAQDHLVVDTRSAAAFGSGHIPASYNIQLSSAEFEQRIGWITPLDAPLILVLAQDAEADSAMQALAFVGLDQRVTGYLAGGIGEWIDAGRPQATVPQISVHELHRHLQNGSVMQVLDVREPSEWQRGHIE